MIDIYWNKDKGGWDSIANGFMGMGGAFGIAGGGSSQQSQFQLSNDSQQAMAQQQLQATLAYQQWSGNSIQHHGYLLQNSIIDQTCEAVNKMNEVTRICFALLHSKKSIRDKKFNFGPWREPGLLTPEEADKIEAEWEADEICREVSKWFQLCDFVANNEVEAIAPGWKE